MGTLERRARERAETRSMILDAARELFVEHGVEAVTMRSIAREIEYTPTAIYHHFRDKRALLVELVVEDFRALGNAFMRIGRIEDPVERIQSIGMAYVTFGLENRSHYRFMFMTPHADAKADEVHAQIRPEEDAYNMLRATVAEAIAVGGLRPELTDVEQVAQMLWAGVHGIVSLHVAMADEHSHIAWRDAHETAQLMVDSMLRGITRQ